MNKIKLMVFVAALFIGFTALTACSAENAPKSVMSGKAADFTLQDINGKEINLYNTLKGKNAVLVFWTTWCPYCVQEIPDIEKFYNENKEKTAVLSINLRESKEKVASFIKRTNMTYPVLLDTDGKIGELYGVRGIPTVIAVGKGKNVLYYGHSIQEAQQSLK
ncbi:MAG: TlpA family protein disulfide reductase [Candidatus Omnitrophica bacterium]|nr:TlpA family protein disulfide reductase [Candidatus Omnitrophota bacterium]